MWNQPSDNILPHIEILNFDKISRHQLYVGTVHHKQHKGKKSGFLKQAQPNAIY